MNEVKTCRNLLLLSKIWLLEEVIITPPSPSLPRAPRYLVASKVLCACECVVHPPCANLHTTFLLLPLHRFYAAHLTGPVPPRHLDLLIAASCPSHLFPESEDTVKGPALISGLD